MPLALGFHKYRNNKVNKQTNKKVQAYNIYSGVNVHFLLAYTRVSLDNVENLIGNDSSSISTVTQFAAWAAKDGDVSQVVTFLFTQNCPKEAG